jgi:type I restriction-modification system DNA methylase subunit
VFSVEILGNAYEQFLGKQIRIDKSHHAHIEEKPEVRKAGGVYYTPEYVVEYIVKNTVGKLITEQSTPETVSPLRIVDPACGSGSFLIGAYQYLVDWHKDYYNRTLKQSKGGKNTPITPEGNLTTAEKKRILLNNIYGVDIDVNAVEVTKLSLLLKCMEGETEASIANQLSLFNERVLPTLDSNIKSGNSLVDTDFYDNQLDFGEEKKIKPFNWQMAFPEVFKPRKTNINPELKQQYKRVFDRATENERRAKELVEKLGGVFEEPEVLYEVPGGFDVVIGNPPYVVLSPEVFSNELISYYRKYSVSQYKCDLYHLFFERGLSILKNGGLLGFITPSNWMTQKFTDLLRKFLLRNYLIVEILDLKYKVFDEQAEVFTDVITIENSFPNELHQILYRQIQSPALFHLGDNTTSHLQKTCLDKPDASIDFRLISNEVVFIDRILNNYPSLIKVARATLGCQAYNSSKHTKEQITNRVFHSETKISEEYLPELAGSDVGRYLLDRKKGKWIKYGNWLHDYRTMDWLQGERILIREITGKPPHRIQATYVTDTYCNYKTILNVNPSESTKVSMKYICGILNSSLISFIFPYVSNKLEANSFPRISVGDLKKLPIKDIEFSNKIEKDFHDEIVSLVELIYQLNNEILIAKLPDKIENLRSRIEYTDSKINSIVYGLYNLTEEEIKIVDGK